MYFDALAVSVADREPVPHRASLADRILERRDRVCMVRGDESIHSHAFDLGRSSLEKLLGRVVDPSHLRYCVGSAHDQHRLGARLHRHPRCPVAFAPGCVDDSRHAGVTEKPSIGSEARLARLANVDAAAIGVDPSQQQTRVSALLGDRAPGEEPSCVVERGRMVELPLLEEIEPLAPRQRGLELDPDEATLGVGFPVDDIGQPAHRCELTIAIIDDRLRRVQLPADLGQCSRHALECGALIPGDWKALFAECDAGSVPGQPFEIAAQSRCLAPGDERQPAGNECGTGEPERAPVGHPRSECPVDGQIACRRSACDQQAQDQGRERSQNGRRKKVIRPGNAGRAGFGHGCGMTDGRYRD